MLYLARNHSKIARDVQITGDQRNAKKKMRFHFTHTSLAKIRKLDNVKHWWGLREIKKPLAPPRNAGGGTV